MNTFKRLLRKADNDEITYENITFIEKSIGESKLDDGGIQKSFRIDAFLKDYQTSLGYIEFDEIISNDQKLIYISYIEVEDYARGFGVSKFIFKKFAEVYNKNYYGWTINASFLNEAAEKAFYGIVNDGLIPSSVVDTYNTYEIEKNSKLSVKQKLTTATSQINESNIEYEVEESTIKDIKDNEKETITINIKYENEYVAYLMFSIDLEKHELCIENIEVWKVYWGLGFAQYLYKKFGEMYRNNYNGWFVEIDFQNPVAETAFKKAIEKGWVPAEAFNETYIKRSF